MPALSLTGALAFVPPRNPSTSPKLPFERGLIFLGSLSGGWISASECLFLSREKTVMQAREGNQAAVALCAIWLSSRSLQFGGASLPTNNSFPPLSVIPVSPQPSFAMTANKPTEDLAGFVARLAAESAGTLCWPHSSQIWESPASASSPSNLQRNEPLRDLPWRRTIGSHGSQAAQTRLSH